MYAGSQLVLAAASRSGLIPSLQLVCGTLVRKSEVIPVYSELLQGTIQLEHLATDVTLHDMYIVHVSLSLSTSIENCEIWFGEGEERTSHGTPISLVLCWCTSG